jgi:predicted ABC-type ATPase
LEKARSDGFDVKVIFVATEHPDLNIARILSRVSRGGLFAPIAHIGEEFEKGLRDLPALKRIVDELILLDNTAEGRSPRVIAQFVNGKIVKVARSIPEWAHRCFEEEFTELMAQKRIRAERIR